MASTGNLPVPWQAYYFFPWNVDPDATPEKPKPTCTLDVMKIHEEAVEKVLADMPKIQKLIIYRTLYAQDMRINGIDREIHKEAAKELKAIKAAASAP